MRKRKERKSTLWQYVNGIQKPTEGDLILRIWNNLSNKMNQVVLGCSPKYKTKIHGRFWEGGRTGSTKNLSPPRKQWHWLNMSDVTSLESTEGLEFPGQGLDGKLWLILIHFRSWSTAAVPHSPPSAPRAAAVHVFLE